MKIAPVMRALSGFADVEQRLIHTGQHYDEKMARVFFEDLGLPRADRDLGVGSGSQAEQTGSVMIGLERVFAEERPDIVVVVGDVNSTLAASLVAAKAGIPVAHVEAGLRSFDLSMPEEINRMVTDRLSALLFTPSRDADENLRREGVPPERIHFVGNVMIDTLLAHRSRAPWPAVRGAFGLEERGYALLTLHRPANVDDAGKFRRILDNLRTVAKDLPIVFPAHPRTARRISEAGLEKETSFLRRTEPLGYLEFLAADGSCRARADRLGRDPGRDDDPRSSLLHSPGQHRTADHRCRGHKHPRRSGRLWPRGELRKAERLDP